MKKEKYEKWKKVELGDNWISLYIKNGNFKNEKSRHKKKKVKKILNQLNIF